MESFCPALAWLEKQIVLLENSGRMKPYLTEGCVMSFSKNFLWGAATAAYQIEGAAAEDGKGHSVWDTFSHTTGKIKNGDTGDTACDHYHRYREDVALMADTGLNAYRFSVSWPRVLPQGTGAANEKGLAFYDRLTDELLAKGIRPCVTLFHWDLPQVLHEKGGWKNPASADWFAEYTELVAKRLGDRIPCWMTFNEILIFLHFGYANGLHAPGEKLPPGELLAILKNILLAHGRSVQVLRRTLPASAKIGIAHAGAAFMPASDKPQDREASYKAMFSVSELSSWPTGSNLLFLDPVLLGRDPEGAAEYFGKDWPGYTAEELSTVSAPIDFLGINCYMGRWVADENGNPVAVNRQPIGKTLFGWPVTPDVLYWAATHYHRRYGKPIIITENGMSACDWVSLDGKVHDPARIDFLRRYLRGLRRAAADGVPVHGYFQWSLMDNFEWSEGFLQRFGLIHVDYETQKRTLKVSALWYKEVIAANGENL